MKIKKAIMSLLVIFIIIFLLVTVINNSKNIWKIFGYTFCENIDNIKVYSVIRDYNNGTINIRGTVQNEEGFYSGYTYNIQQDKLYIGLKYNKYYGYEYKTKDFFIQVPCKLNEVKSIYLVDMANEKKI